jgi:hypothetical protein
MKKGVKKDGDEFEIVTAVIDCANIVRCDSGYIDITIRLDCSVGVCGFSGNLYISSENPVNFVGKFISRVMKIAGVVCWNDLPGKAIRVNLFKPNGRVLGSKAVAIGHIINDDWFNPETDL